ncbi:MAG: HD family hydrolase [Fervidicoccaceae archaeon]
MENILSCIDALKSLVRTGWMQGGVSASIAETLSSHMYEVALLSFIITTKASRAGLNVNIEKTVILSLLHDVPECLVGDLNYYAKAAIGKDRKKQIEFEAMSEIAEDPQINALFSEYIEGKSLESKIVEAADKLSTLRQARRYSRLGYDFNEMEEGLRKEILEIVDGLDSKLRDIIEEIMEAS